MTRNELEQIFSLPSVAIVAPAGHGKTEMIADMVNYRPGRQLILTHTNAGVDALKKRMLKRNISQERYQITTIAGFCSKWCLSYYHTADFDLRFSAESPKKELKVYYKQLYNGPRKIFAHEWAGEILKATYTGIIVDEYQDCNLAQHRVILAMSQYLPVRVLGDPMQGIFDFDGTLVDWNHLEFPIKVLKTKPWRWAKSNPELGEYLMKIRDRLLPALEGKSCTVKMEDVNGSIEVISPNRLKEYFLLDELKDYQSTVFITTWEREQMKFSKYFPGIFQYDEKQECDELSRYAKLFDTEKGTDLLYDALIFTKECATGISKEMASYINHLQNGDLNFSKISKCREFQAIVPEREEEISYETLLDILYWVSRKKSFKKYRKELLSEMMRSVRYAVDHDMTISEAAVHIRKDAPLQKRYTDFKCLSSRTLLSKGLEFDCVIIDMRKGMSAKNFYVAMTRAMKKIYIVADTDTFTFCGDDSK